MRPSSILIAVLSAAAIASMAIPACNANVTEGCATAQCDVNPTTVSGSGGASSGSATGGAGGMGGDPLPPIPEAPECMTMPPPDPPAGDIPCAVFAVIHRDCNPCHQGYDPHTGMTPGPLMGAPFPLLTYENIASCYGNNYKRSAIMLALINADGPSKYGVPMPNGTGPLKTLNPPDYKILNDWLLAGAPPDPDGTSCECKDGWPAVMGGMGCD